MGSNLTISEQYNGMHPIVGFSEVYPNRTQNAVGMANILAAGFIPAQAIANKWQKCRRYDLYWAFRANKARLENPSTPVLSIDEVTARLKFYS